jgi:hypothetical protein
MSYWQRLMLGLGVIASIIMPVQILVITPINEYSNYQEYLKRKHAIEEYTKRMEYHCNQIFTPQKEYICEKFFQSQKSGNFKIAQPGKTVEGQVQRQY